ncbi:MAG: hypothetical protein JKY37_21390 [Nannocystaceae bacterium]|nr:hypothetical protein [Nannocystaceae bacterium]
MDHPRPSVTLRLLPTLVAGVAIAFVSGCQDDGNGGSEPASDTGSPPEEAAASEVCDTGVLGFPRRCFLNSLDWDSDLAAIDNLSAESGLELGAIFPGSHGCCGGCAPEAVADAHCQETCMELACDRARDTHKSFVSNYCCSGDNCGFKFSDCVAGGTVTQKFDCNWTCALIGVCNDTYDLKVSCDAENNEVYDATTGCLDAIGENDFDPDYCATSMLVSAGSLAAQDNAVEAAGTNARVVWSLGSISGVESTTDLEAEVAYKVTPCQGSECITLTQLEVQGPDIVVGGLTITDVRFTMLGSNASPKVSSRGRFKFPAGSLDFSLSYRVMGLYNHLLGTNDTTFTGRVVPLADDLLLSGMTFRHTDAFLDATLHLTIDGEYVERTPVVSIAVLDDPSLCSEPVVFDATSVDPEGKPMTHVWEVPGLITATGPTLSVVLPNHPSAIMLMSTDPAGRSSAMTLEHTRACQ